MLHCKFEKYLLHVFPPVLQVAATCCTKLNSCLLRARNCCYLVLLQGNFVKTKISRKSITKCMSTKQLGVAVETGFKRLRDEESLCTEDSDWFRRRTLSLIFVRLGTAKITLGPTNISNVNNSKLSRSRPMP